MTRRRKTLTKADRQVVQATFTAISTAMGWDKAFPESLLSAVWARLDQAGIDLISRMDEQLEAEMNPEPKGEL